MTHSHARWVGAAILMLTPLGCMDRSLGAQNAQHAITARDAQIRLMAQQMHQMAAMLRTQNAALHARENDLRAATQNASTAQGQIAKLNELIAINQRMVNQLASAEAAITQLQKKTNAGSDDPEVAIAATELDQQLEHHAFDHQFDDSLASVQNLQVSAKARTAAYKRLLRQVQYLIDTGRVRAVRVADGGIRFKLAPELDGTGDPWKDSAPPAPPAASPDPSIIQ